MIDELINKQVEEGDFSYIPHEEYCAFYEASSCNCNRPDTVKKVKAHLRSSMLKVGEEILNVIKKEQKYCETHKRPPGTGSKYLRMGYEQALLFIESKIHSLTDKGE